MRSLRSRSTILRFLQLVTSPVGVAPGREVLSAHLLLLLPSPVQIICFDVAAHNVPLESRHLRTEILAG